MSTETNDFDRFMSGRQAVGQAYVTGDAGPLAAISAHADPATFFPPNGGQIQGAADVLAVHQRGAGLFRPGGTTLFEILHTDSSGDIGYWVGIQHADVRIEGVDQLTGMHLRITEIFRRENGSWKLIHRHADPHATTTSE